MNGFKQKFVDMGPPVPQRTYSAGIGTDNNGPTRPAPEKPSGKTTDSNFRLSMPLKVNKTKAAIKGYELYNEFETSKNDSSSSKRPEISVVSARPLNGSLADFDPLITTTNVTYAKNAWNNSGFSESDFNMKPLVDLSDRKYQAKSQNSLLDLAGLDLVRSNDANSPMMRPPISGSKPLVKPLAPQPAVRPSVAAKPSTFHSLWDDAAPRAVAVLPAKAHAFNSNKDADPWDTTTTTNMTPTTAAPATSNAAPAEKKGFSKFLKITTKPNAARAPDPPASIRGSASNPDFTSGAKPQRPTVIRPPTKPNKPPNLNGVGKLDLASKSYFPASSSSDQIGGNNGMSDAARKMKKHAPPRPKSGPPRPMKPPQINKQNGGPSPDLPSRPGPGHVLYPYTLQLNKPHGRALYDYRALQSDELSMKAGEIVHLVSRLDENWYTGEIGQRRGLFPANFIEVLQPIVEHKRQSVSGPKCHGNERNNIAASKLDRPELGPRCRARFDFEGENDGDLSFAEGDVFKILERVGDEWMRGKHRGLEGLFPVAFVEILEDLPRTGAGAPGASSAVAGASWPAWDTEPSPAAQETQEVESRIRAIYDFDGKDGELRFKAGEKIQLLSRVDEDWLYGELDGRRGRFPVKFVARSQIPVNLPKFTGDVIKPKSHFTKAESPVKTAPKNKEPGAVVADKPHCVAVYDFCTQQEGDLAFRVGDVITLTSRLGDDWLIGARADGTSGMFPLGYVRVVVDLPDEMSVAEPSTPDFGPLPPTPTAVSPNMTDIPHAKALYDYDAQTDEELSFKEGDVIVLLDRLDENWLTGELNGQIRHVPECLLQIITPLST